MWSTRPTASHNKIEFLHVLTMKRGAPSKSWKVSDDQVAHMMAMTKTKRQEADVRCARRHEHEAAQNLAILQYHTATSRILLQPKVSCAEENAAKKSERTTKDKLSNDVRPLEPRFGGRRQLIPRTETWHPVTTKCTECLAKVVSYFQVWDRVWVKLQDATSRQAEGRSNSCKSSSCRKLAGFAEPLIAWDFN